MRFLLAFDTQDDDLGHFWTHCKTDIVNNLTTTNKFNYQVLETHELYKTNVESSISNFGGNSFICLAYSHGQKDSLHGKYEVYIDKQSAYLFGGSFFYTFSCYVGTELGPHLVENDCKAFIGYLDKAQIEVNNVELFVQCVNSGFHSFLNGNNAWNCLSVIRNVYDDAMDVVSDDLVAYSTLRRNRDSLCFYGNPNLKISDL